MSSITLFAAAYVGAMRKLVGTVREREPNRHEAIDYWLGACGVPLGNPWCAAMATVVARDVAAEIGTPECWPFGVTASCVQLIRRARPLHRWHPIEEGYQPKLGDLVLYGRSGQRPDRGGAGHVAALVDVERELCVSGNLDDQVQLHALDLPEHPALQRVGWVEI